MTTTQIDRTSNEPATRHVPRRPEVKVAVATATTQDVEDARNAAAVAALVAAVALLILGIITMATTSITASAHRSFAMTAALAMGPFAVAGLVYARHRVIRIDANRWH